MLINSSFSLSYDVFKRFPNQGYWDHVKWIKPINMTISCKHAIVHAEPNSLPKNISSC